MASAPHTLWLATWTTTAHLTIVGAWQFSGSAGAGRAYLYLGKSGALVKTSTRRIPGDTFGFDAVGSGMSMGTAPWIC
jgi:hypothetical protein